MTDHAESNSPPAGDDKPLTLSEEVRVGRLDGLQALRDVLALKIEAGPTSEKAADQTAPLARQLRDVLRDIEQLERLVPKGSVVDELTSRRKDRRASIAEGESVPGGQEGVVGS